MVLLACVGAWTAAITATHLPSSDLPSMEVSDKTLHLAGFTGLAGLFGLTLAAYDTARRRRILLMLLIMPAYGAMDELTQPYFGRSCELADWACDVVGAVAAMAVLELALTGLGRLWPVSAAAQQPE